jgi:hypothetical protein
MNERCEARRDVRRGNRQTFNKTAALIYPVVEPAVRNERHASRYGLRLKMPRSGN